MQPHDEHVRRIAASLRYRALDFLIGQTVQVDSLSNITSNVREALPEIALWIGDLAVEAPDLRRAAAKYGILALTFEASPDALEADFETGMDLLGALGFMMSPDETSAFAEVAELVGDNFDDPTLLGELEADLSEGVTYLHLLLCDLSPADARLRARGDLPPDYFPRLFAVEDAALSNTSLAWVHKHMFL